MCADQANTKPFVLLNENPETSSIVTAEELRLLAEWSVPDLAYILNNPESVLDEYADDYIRFHERAGRIMEALMGHIQPELFTVRFGVAGVTLDLLNDFKLEQNYLDQLWKHERPIVHWVRQQGTELTDVAAMGRPYALAQATLEVIGLTGMTRLEAIDNKCYDAFLRQIYLRAFNLFGVMPLPIEELGIKGLDPWMQVAQGKNLNPICCNGQQLQLFARRCFRDFDIPFSSFSVLKNLPFLLPISERGKDRDWRELIQSELSTIWLNGGDGEMLESVLDYLNQFDHAPNNYQMLG